MNGIRFVQRHLAQAGDLELAGHPHRAGHHGEVVGGDAGGAAVDVAPAGDDAVGGRLDPVHRPLGEVRPAVDAELDEGALVDQQVDPLARGQLAALVLLGDLLLAAAELRLRAALVQLLGQLRQRTPCPAACGPSRSSSPSSLDLWLWPCSLTALCLLPGNDMPLAQPAPPPTIARFALSYERGGGLIGESRSLRIAPGRNATVKARGKTVRFRVSVDRVQATQSPGKLRLREHAQPETEQLRRLLLLRHQLPPAQRPNSASSTNRRHWLGWSTSSRRWPKLIFPSTEALASRRRR